MNPTIFSSSIMRGENLAPIKYGIWFHDPNREIWQAITEALRAKRQVYLRNDGHGRASCIGSADTLIGVSDSNSDRSAVISNTLV